MIREQKFLTSDYIIEQQERGIVGSIVPNTGRIGNHHSGIHQLQEATVPLVLAYHNCVQVRRTIPDKCWRDVLVDTGNSSVACRQQEYNHHRYNPAAHHNKIIQF